MDLELQELKKMHEKAFLANQIPRERSSNDLVFYWVTQWDDNVLKSSQLAYRGEFDVLRKAGRQILSDLSANPVQVDFTPINETRTDSAELADGLYRAGLQKNTSIEAFENAETENVVCGIGAWLLYTKYESQNVNNDKQVILRKPIFEANNTVFWDPQSKLLDKSDAKYCSVLTAYSEDGYKNLIKELTNEEIDHIDAGSFKHPEHSYTFPWVGGEGKKIYVTSFYHIEEINDTILTMEDPFGETLDLRESDLMSIMDDLLDEGYSIISEKKIKRNVVTKYIASGREIIKSERMAGQYIPVIPCYGEHAVIEGEEYWEGITRLAKDPQRLRNFAFSYMGDILSRSPRQKPLFWPEQIQGFEDMYSESGIDNAYPYGLINRKAADGEELPPMPIGVMPEQPMPTALPLVLAQTKEAVTDVANPGVPDKVAEPDISGKAVQKLEARIERQSMRFQTHMKHAKRRDGEVWISMASEIIDTPRKVMVELPDGAKKETQVMDTIIDKETGDLITVNDLRRAEFEVFSKIGPSYSSQKEQTIDRLQMMMMQMSPDDPIRKALQLKILALSDGVEFSDIRDYVNKQLITMGIRKPQTPEEEEFAEQMQNQPKQPDAATMIAIAENKKGDADLLEQKRKGIEMQLKAQNDERQSAIDAFDAETKRMAVMISLKEANAKIDMEGIEALGKQVDRATKLIDLKDVTKNVNKQLSSGSS
ncbi:MAG: portal protein [Candidatus Heimdallarchaeaceae archaeon]